MEEEKQDVIVDPSTTQEPEPEQTQEPIEGEQQVQEEPSQPQEVKPSGQLPPTDGRPEINYAMEALRKVNEFGDTLKQIQSTIQTQPQQPQYGEAELQAYLSKPDLSDSERLAVARELDKVRQKKEEEREKRISESLRHQSQQEIARKESYDFVANNFPDCFHRDNMGRTLGWNESNPMTRQIGYYLNTNKELASNPAGLMAAAKMAAFDLGISLNPKVMKKLNQTTAQLRKEQKKNLINAGGINTASTRETTNAAKGEKLLAEYQRTQNPALLLELMKLKKDSADVLRR